jgi:DNA mismatch repair protein MutL
MPAIGAARESSTWSTPEHTADPVAYDPYQTPDPSGLQTTPHAGGSRPETLEGDPRHRLDSADPSAGDDSRRALQIQDCYLVTATDEGMMVIDQHALHERILYEYLRPRVLDGAVESQQLLMPESIECSVKEVAQIEEHQALFSQLGFGIESFGGQTMLLTCYPAMLHKADLTQIIRDLCEHLETSQQDPSRRDILDELLHMMSCKGAIKSGQRLSPEEIQSLLEQSHLVDDAHHCPHGRPTALVLTRADLDRQFGRLG